MAYPGVAQLVARLVRDQEAVGSNPVTRTKNGRVTFVALPFFILNKDEPTASSFQSSAVRSYLRSCMTVGSNPVTRTKKPKIASAVFGFFFCFNPPPPNKNIPTPMELGCFQRHSDRSRNLLFCHFFTASLAQQMRTYPDDQCKPIEQ